MSQVARKCTKLLFRRDMKTAPATRHIEPSSPIRPVDTVEAEAIEVNKPRSLRAFAERRLVKIAQVVVVVRLSRHRTYLAPDCMRERPHTPVRGNQRAVRVAQDRGTRRKTQVERTGSRKRLNIASKLRRHCRLQHVQDRPLATRPSDDRCCQRASALVGLLSRAIISSTGPALLTSHAGRRAPGDAARDGTVKASDDKAGLAEIEHRIGLGRNTSLDLVCISPSSTEIKSKLVYGGRREIEGGGGFS